MEPDYKEDEEVNIVGGRKLFDASQVSKSSDNSDKIIERFENLKQILSAEEEKHTAYNDISEEDHSFGAAMHDYDMVHTDLCDCLKYFAEEVQEPYNHEKIGESVKQSIAGALIGTSMIPELFRLKGEISINALIVIERLLEKENAFENHFIEANIIEALHEIYDAPMKSSKFTVIVEILASLIDFSKEIGTRIYEEFPLLNLIERSQNYYDKNHQIAKRPQEALLKFSMFLIRKDIEISTEDFAVIIDIISMNYQICNECAYHIFIHTFYNLALAWPSDEENCPISLFETHGLRQIIDRVIVDQIEIKNYVGCVCYIFDGLGEFAKKGILFEFEYSKFWEFLMSSHIDIQNSASNFWLDVLSLPRERWNDLVSEDNIGELVYDFMPEQQYEVKLHVLDIASAYMMQQTPQELYSFVFEHDDMLSLLVEAVPLSCSKALRLRALIRIAQLYDSIPVNDRSGYVDKLMSVEWDEIDELTENESPKIAQTATELKEALDTYDDGD